MNFGFWLGIYLALGLPIAVGLALIESGAPLIRRVLMALNILPIWPVWTVGLFVAYHRMIQPHISCAWCGEVVGDDEQDWRAHLMKCPQHPIREWLHDQGYEIIDNGDEDYELAEYYPNDKRWKVTEYDDKVVIVPLNDLREHDEESETCACEPKIEEVNGMKIITHQAYDFREVCEYLNEKKGGEE